MTMMMMMLCVFRPAEREGEQEDGLQVLV